LEVASALHILYPGQYKLDALDGLMRNQATLDALVAGEDPRRIAEDWQDALETFEIVRSKYLLY
jgi:hypothetical protein